jgi:hypothetical protein
LIFVKAESSNRNDINTRCRKLTRKFLELTKEQPRRGDHNRGQRYTKEEQHNRCGYFHCSWATKFKQKENKNKTLICCGITAQNDLQEIPTICNVLHFRHPTHIMIGGGIATGSERSEFESCYGQEFSLLHVVQPGSGVHSTSYPMGTGGSFPGGKAAGACS